MALRHAIAGACFASLASAPSAAADLGGVTPTSLRFDGTVPAPIWTGLYIGADGGFSFASGATANGFVGGLHAGYNYQIGHWVFGIETDLAYDSFFDQQPHVRSFTWLGRHAAPAAWLRHGSPAILRYGRPGLRQLCSILFDRRRSPRLDCGSRSRVCAQQQNESAA
jgi:opacity protein-like surface antigen